LRIVKLPKERFSELFEALKSWGEVHAPVKVGRFYSFKRVESLGEFTLSYTRTMIPPKKYFVKPFEDILKVHVEKGYEPIVEESKRIVLLGVHACDINALRILDGVYMDEIPDHYYASRRSNSMIVGVSCEPDEYCFCKSVGADYAWTGFDLFLHDIGDSYLIRVGGSKGESIVAELTGVVEEPTSIDYVKLRDYELKRSRMFRRSLNASYLPEVVDSLYGSELWAKYSDKCLGCGSCNLVCPTCRCYDVTESLDLNMVEGVRSRRWDSCFLRSHALVAGGLNFRPTRLDRFKHRYNCKSSIDQRTGMLFCVGCGRCTVFCPAGIDHLEVLNSIWGLR